MDGAPWDDPRRTRGRDGVESGAGHEPLKGKNRRVQGERSRRVTGRRSLGPTEIEVLYRSSQSRVVEREVGGGRRPTDSSGKRPGQDGRRDIGGLGRRLFSGSFVTDVYCVKRGQTRTGHTRCTL